jgi:hypothetical protein
MVTSEICQVEDWDGMTGIVKRLARYSQLGFATSHIAVLGN